MAAKSSGGRSPGPKKSNSSVPMKASRGTTGGGGVPANGNAVPPGSNMYYIRKTAQGSVPKLGAAKKSSPRTSRAKKK